MRDRGVTLVELLVVISVIGILAIALGFSYVGWQGAYKVEKTTKDLHTDLVDAWSRALTRNRTYFAVLNANSYSIIEDANNNAVNDDAALPTFPKTVEYNISTDAGGVLIFPSRGIINAPNITIANPDIAICFSTTAAPDYDCIEISQTRINMGNLTTQISGGGACNAANCVAK